MEDRTGAQPPAFWKSPAGLTFLVVAVIGGFYLVTEHRAHLYGILPYLVLAACPLMHLFMHKGHGRGGHGRRGDPDRSIRDNHDRHGY